MYQLIFLPGGLKHDLSALVIVCIIHKILSWWPKIPSCEDLCFSEALPQDKPFADTQMMSNRNGLQKTN